MTSPAPQQHRSDRVTITPYHPAWTAEATCARIGGDGWFLDESDDDLCDAVRACQQACPVRTQCLDYGMGHELGVSRPGRHGIWGGLTPQQRIAYEPQWLAEPARQTPDRSI